MTDDMINIILQFRAAHFELFNFLVRREIDILFDAVYLVIKTMVLIEQASKMVIRAFQPANDLAMFRELSQDRMMKVHGDNSCVLLCVTNGLGTHWAEKDQGESESARLLF